MEANPPTSPPPPPSQVASAFYWPRIVSPPLTMCIGQYLSDGIKNSFTLDMADHPRRTFLWRDVRWKLQGGENQKKERHPFVINCVSALGNENASDCLPGVLLHSVIIHVGSGSSWGVGVPAKNNFTHFKHPFSPSPTLLCSRTIIGQVPRNCSSHSPFKQKGRILIKCKMWRVWVGGQRARRDGGGTGSLSKFSSNY